MADGYITYSTKLDNKELEKELSKANKRVEQLEGQLQKNADKRLPISKQVSELGGQLDAAKAKLAALQDESQRVSAAITGANTNDPASVAAYTEAAARQAGVTKELAAQQKLVDSLQGKFDRAANRLDAIDASSARVSAELDAAKYHAGALAAELYKPATAADAVAEAVKNADKQMKKFSDHVKGLARRVFIFTVITAALRSVKDWMGKVAAANSETSAAVAQLKGALLTLAQPITAVLIPAFTSLLNVLTSIVGEVARIVAALFGTTIDQSREAAEALYDETSALNATGSAAKKASKSLASFDEINKLAGDTAEAGGAAGTIAPVFELDANVGGVFDILKSKAAEIGEDIKTIFSGVGDFISGVFTGNFDNALDGLVSALGGARNLIVDLLELADVLVGGFVDSIIQKFNLVGTTIGNILLGVKRTFHGIVEFITGILNGDLTKAIVGIEDIFDGLKTVAIEVFNSLIALLPKPLANFLQLVRDLFVDVLDTAKEFLTGVIQFINGVFSDDWNLAWKGIVNIGIALLNGMVAAFEAVFGFIARAINELIATINKVVTAAAEMIGADWKGISWRATEPIFGRIPLLAKGAVIPPNREFLAVLGDQKSGTNIEAPVSEIEAAVARGIRMAGGYGGRDMKIILELDHQQLASAVYRLNKEESRRIGVNLAEW